VILKQRSSLPLSSPRFLSSFGSNSSDSLLSVRKAMDENESLSFSEESEDLSVSSHSIALSSSSSSSSLLSSSTSLESLLDAEDYSPGSTPRTIFEESSEDWKVSSPPSFSFSSLFSQLSHNSLGFSICISYGSCC
jgi:hypothetical protein